MKHYLAFVGILSSILAAVGTAAGATIDHRAASTRRVPIARHRSEKPVQRDGRSLYTYACPDVETGMKENGGFAWFACPEVCDSMDSTMTCTGSTNGQSPYLPTCTNITCDTTSRGCTSSTNTTQVEFCMSERITIDYEIVVVEETMTTLTTDVLELSREFEWEISNGSSNIDKFVLDLTEVDPSDPTQYSNNCTFYIHEPKSSYKFLSCASCRHCDDSNNDNGGGGEFSFAIDCTNLVDGASIECAPFNNERSQGIQSIAEKMIIFGEPEEEMVSSASASHFRTIIVTIPAVLVVAIMIV